MASSIPEQIRTVDPYASYNSNVVNQLTGIVTRGSNGLDICNSLQVVPDSTSAIDHVAVLPGIIYKDDMLIEITSQFRVDFTDPDHYVSATGDPFNTEDGIYYIVLEYTYRKSRPAPKAHIKILLPSQVPNYFAGGFPSLFFLKAVDVEVTGGAGSIAALYDYDPNNTQVKREYVHNHTGTEIFLPPFEQARDQSRMVYIPQEDEFYFGYSDRWGPAGGGGGSTINADTSGFAVGDLVYINSTGAVTLASAQFHSTTADGVVIRSSVNGLIKMSGLVYDVKVQPGQTVVTSSLVYLSTTNPGTVVPYRTSPTWQFVGRCKGVVDSTSVNVLFVRGEPNGLVGLQYAISEYGKASGSAWLPDDATAPTFVYQDLDISSFENTKTISTVWDSTSGYRIDPTNLEYLDDNTLRLWMPSDFDKDLDFLIIGPSQIPVSTASVEKITDTLSGTDWISSGSSYYATINTSTIDLSDGAVVVCYNSSGEQVIPDSVQYLSTSVRVWMPVNTEVIDVVIIGPTTLTTSVSTLYATLPSGSAWTADSGMYYQDIDISSFSSDDVVYELHDISSSEKIEASATIPITGTLRIWMPDNSHNLEITVIG